MRRLSRTWFVPVAVTCTAATVACEALLDVGSLSERTSDGGVRDAPPSDAPSGGFESGPSTDAPSLPDAPRAPDSGTPDAMASDAASLDAAPPPCDAGARRCNVSAPQTCVNGQWQDEPACSGATPVCAAGVCTGDPPSCGGGGAGAGSNCTSGAVDCCATLGVIGGTYDRSYGYTDAGGPSSQSDPATVSDFRLDEFEVTVGRFRKFVAAWNGGDAGYFPSPGSGKHAHLNGGLGLANSAAAGGYETGWVASDDINVAPTDANLGSSCSSNAATWTPSPGANEKLPITCVNWYEAYAFCIWDVGFLPSEAEWEYAAAGGMADREYPWGSASPGQGNVAAIYGCFFPNGSGTCTGVANIAPVGTPIDGRGMWGQFDLAGNVQEWVLDYVHASYVVPCVDCATVTAGAAGTGRVYRGGNWGTGLTSLLPTSAVGVPPTFRDGSGGFRCARAP